jgi:hypothetical protein
MNSKLLALGAQKRFQVERETKATHQKVTDWVEETTRLSKRASERERERRTNQVSRSQISNWQE